MKYLVTITLSNGNQIKAKINGHDEHDAIKNLQHNEEAMKFINSEENIFANIEDMKAEPLQPRYDFRISNGVCKCLDTKFGFAVEWEIGRYNETAKTSRLETSTKYRFEDTSGMDALQVATIMQEMGEWIATFHYDEAFSPLTTNQRIAKMLQDAIQKSGVTEAYLSEATGKKLNRISSYISGLYPPSASMLLQLARAMGAELRIVFPDEQ